MANCFGLHRWPLVSHSAGFRVAKSAKQSFVIVYQLLFLRLAKLESIFAKLHVKKATCITREGKLFYVYIPYFKNSLLKTPFLLAAAN